MKFKENFRIWKRVFNYKFIILALSIALIFYGINVIIANWKTLISVFSSNGLISFIQIFFKLSLGFGKTIEWYSFTSLLIISFLLGMFFSLITYKTISIKSTNKESGFYALMGVFLGILVPGCAACGIGFLSAFGLGIFFLNVLPFKGLEISILSIFLLAFAIFKITDKINKGNSCSL